MKNNKDIRIVSPWVNYYRELETMFKKDPEVRVLYDEEENEVKLFVDSQEKATALMILLPKVKEFGNVKLYITVIPANITTGKADIFRQAFKGNPIFSDAFTVDVASTNSFTYVSYVPEVAQYWGDNLANPHGLISTLYEDIARDIFDDQGGVYYTTDTVEKEEDVK